MGIPELSRRYQGGACIILSENKLLLDEIALYELPNNPMCRAIEYDTLPLMEKLVNHFDYYEHSENYRTR